MRGDKSERPTGLEGTPAWHRGQRSQLTSSVSRWSVRKGSDLPQVRLAVATCACDQWQVKVAGKQVQ